jgi:Fe2+ transport system protein FeoA
MSEGYVTCPLCAFAFEKQDTMCGHGCPLGATCRLLRCPSCGYEFPQRPASVSWLERLLGRRDEAACALPAGVRRLGELGRDEAARVVCVGTEGPGRPGALAAFGLVPGAEIRLVQRRPACVVRVDETELALDGNMADEILVAPLEAPVAGGPSGRP